MNMGAASMTIRQKVGNGIMLVVRAVIAHVCSNIFATVIQRTLNYLIEPSSVFCIYLFDQ